MSKKTDSVKNSKNAQSSRTDTELKFNLKPVTEKPSRKYRKGSKYDPILDSFITSGEIISKVDIVDVDKEIYYYCSQINLRIKKRDLEDKINSYTSDKSLYIELFNDLRRARNELIHSIKETIDVDDNEAKKILGIIYSSSVNYGRKR